MENKPVIAITCGDLNGIGPELIIKLFATDYIFNYCIPVIYMNPKPFNFFKKTFGAANLKYHSIATAKEAIADTFNLCVCDDSEFMVEFGKPSIDSAKQAMLSLDRALEDINNGYVQGLVTAPVDKATCAQVVSDFTGHTGYITKHLKATNSCMILYMDNLRVALATEHVPVNKITDVLTKDLLINKINAVHLSLKEDFLIIRPRIAVLGLNPHAGDSGLLGNEEEKIIKPAIKHVFEQEKLVFGPYPADTYFGSKNMSAFDAVIAMYHDQGLAPFKTIAFEDGVNFTAGLPIIRTSPDHGVAYDIAGKNIACITSFQSAIHECIKLINNRLQNEELNKSPLQFSELKRERFRINF